MTSSFIHFAVPLLLVVTACGSSKSESAATPTSYEAYCAAQVAPGCSKIPAGYEEACKQVQIAQRAKVKPACLEKFDAMMQCGATKPTYSCSATGLPQSTPSGVCGNEAIDCYTCNGTECESVF